MYLKLKAEKTSCLKFYADAESAVHLYFKLHTGATLTMGKVSITSVSQKQKLDTKINTKAELVGADDASSLMLWTTCFLEAQGYKVKQNILYQDNKSTIPLQKTANRVRVKIQYI